MLRRNYAWFAQGGFRDWSVRGEVEPPSPDRERDLDRTLSTWLERESAGVVTDARERGFLERFDLEPVED